MVGAALGEIAEKLCRSTVQIRGRKQQLGSGVIWAAEGLIVTNAHVVGSSDLRVELWNGRSVAARVRKCDRHRDLASVQIECDGLAVANLGDSEALRSGELVIAVGNPFGFAGAVSTGVFHFNGVSPEFSQPWLVSNVRLAPGNSGGPLANSGGEVVGINTMIAGGLALSIPSKSVRYFLSAPDRAQLRLGVVVRPMPLDRSSGQLGLLVLEVVPHSPAERASLLPGDLLVSAGQTSFRSLEDFQSTLDRSRDGQLEIEFRRGESKRTRRVVAQLHWQSPRAA